MQDVFDWLGVSGIVALVLGIFSHGRLAQRVEAVEGRVKTSDDNARALARLEAKFEERTGAIMRDLEDIKKAVGK